MPTARILLADDEAAPRHACRQALEQAGFHVLEAGDGAELIVLAQHHRPHLILVDLLMPGMDGFEAIYELKQHEPTRAIPILYLSTLPPEETVTQGVARFLTKPFERDDLLRAVRAIVASPAGGQSPPPILVVDDERDIVEIVCAYLADAGYQGVPAYDGEAAPAAITRQPPAAVILDIKMPGVDGYGVIRWIKRHPVHRQIPIIVLTATKVHRISQGGTRPAPVRLTTIPKPCDPARLVAAVQEQLRAP